MSNSNLIQFKNCRLLRDHQIVKDDLWVRDGKIIDPAVIFFDEKVPSAVQIDSKNAIIAPGFIDLQINGGFGVDFSSDIAKVKEGVRKVSKGLLAYGVTSFCPTLVTSPDATYHTVLAEIHRTEGGKDGAGILGLHLEGPFINPSKKGAHPENCIKKLDEGMKSVLSTYSNLDDVSIITLAPELDHSSEVIQELSKMGITVSLGHSMGNISDGEKAVKDGAGLITHLFNAMLPFHHRDPGLVGLLTSHEIPAGRTMYFGIIADGVHTHPSALRIAHRTHPNGLILVTDAISALGLEEGVHYIGQLALEVKDGKAFIAGTNTLCGSIAPMDECIRVFRTSTNCSTVYALETASLHPAKCLGIEHSKGTLDIGTDADFVLLNDDLEVQSTWIAGECVFNLNDKITA